MLENFEGKLHSGWLGLSELFPKFHLHFKLQSNLNRKIWHDFSTLIYGICWIRGEF